MLTSTTEVATLFLPPRKSAACLAPGRSRHQGFCEDARLPDGTSRVGKRSMYLPALSIVSIIRLQIQHWPIQNQEALHLEVAAVPISQPSVLVQDSLVDAQGRWSPLYVHRGADEEVGGWEHCSGRPTMPPAGGPRSFRMRTLRNQGLSARYQGRISDSSARSAGARPRREQGLLPRLQAAWDGPCRFPRVTSWIALIPEGLPVKSLALRALCGARARAGSVWKAFVSAKCRGR